MLVPSFVAKLARAKKHLVDLEVEIGRYVATHPYTVRTRVEGKKQRTVHRLAFTADPANTDIPLIAADAIYNLRASLDHLMSCLVPHDQRSSAMFPIYFQGVWETPVPGEDQQRSNARKRWAFDVKSLPAPAVAILKSLQPPDTSGAGNEIHLVQTINRLSNRDRHEKLPVVATGLGSVQAEFVEPDGTPKVARSPKVGAVIQDNAYIGAIPEGAVDVKIQGIPVVAIRIGKPEGVVAIPDRLVCAADHISAGSSRR